MNRVDHTLNSIRYTEVNFPTYERLEAHHVSGLTRERYESVKRRYMGTLIPPRDPEILYPEHTEGLNVLTWAEHQIAEVITYSL